MLNDYFKVNIFPLTSLPACLYTSPFCPTFLIVQWLYPYSHLCVRNSGFPHYFEVLNKILNSQIHPCYHKIVQHYICPIILIDKPYIEYFIMMIIILTIIEHHIIAKYCSKGFHVLTHLIFTIRWSRHCFFISVQLKCREAK